MQRFIGGKVSHNRFCKADRLNKTVAGTFSIPLKESPSKEKTTFGFCMRKEELIFIDDAGKVRQILDEMQGVSADGQFLSGLAAV